MNKTIEVIPEDVLEVLTNYEWPGNVRELQNFVERSVILSTGPALCPPLAELSGPAATPMPPTSSRLKDLERDYIEGALAQTGWVVGGPNGAAARLGLQRTTLISKMKRLGIRARMCSTLKWTAAQRKPCWKDKWGRRGG